MPKAHLYTLMLLEKSVYADKMKARCTCSIQPSVLKKYKVIIRWPTLIAHEEQSSDEDNQTHFLVNSK